MSCRLTCENENSATNDGTYTEGHEMPGAQDPFQGPVGLAGFLENALDRFSCKTSHAV